MVSDESKGALIAIILITIVVIAGFSTYLIVMTPPREYVEPVNPYLEAFTEAYDYIELRGYPLTRANVPSVSAGTFGHDTTHRTYRWYGDGVDYGTLTAFLEDYNINANGSLYWDNEYYFNSYRYSGIFWFVASDGVIVMAYGMAGW